MKTYLTRRLLVIAALASPFVLALSLGAATAEAGLIRGRSAHRFLPASGSFHGVALVITVMAAVLVVLVATYWPVRSSLRATAAADPVLIPVESDTSLDETRRAA